MTGREPVVVAAVPICATSFSEAVDLLSAPPEAGAPGATSVRLVNAWSIVCAHDDPNYLDVMTGHGINLPDGRPLSRRVRRKEGGAEQVRGPSLFRAVLDHGRALGMRHFFVGASDETLTRLVSNVTKQVPGVLIEGTHAPPFTEDIASLASDCSRAVSSTRADIIWVGLGTPKQDLVAVQLAEQTGAWVVGIGAAFDFVAGTTQEAPVWMTKTGTEWLYRLASEPRRLWRRYLIGNVRYLWLAATR